MTTEQWTRDEADDRDKHTTPTMHKWRARYGDVTTWSLCRASTAFRTHSLAFDPSVAEAAAALRMPHNDFGSAYTREAVHAFMAAEATPSGEPEPEWHEWVRAAQPTSGWTLKPEYTDADGDYWVRVAAPNGRGHSCCISRGTKDKAARLRARVQGIAKWWFLPDPYAPAPVQPVEPRRFRVGDRVRHASGTEYVVSGVSADGQKIGVEGHGGVRWAAAAYTLVTPAPEEPACDEVFVPDGHATPAGVVTRAGIVNDVFGVYVRPDRPRAYDEGGTNPAGFPVMPEPTGGTVIVADTSPHKVDLWKSEPASVVLPFDAWLAAREREQSEPEPYDPREGDEVEVHVGDAPNYVGVFARYSEDGDLVVRYRDHGHERFVVVHPCLVTLVRRPGGVR